MSRIKVEGVLALDGSGWDKTLRKAEGGINNLANGSLGNLKSMVAGAFTIGAVTSFIKSTVDAMTAIKDFSEQTGISTDDVQYLQIAARDCGLEFADFATALDKLGASRKDAAESNQDLRNTFERLGISMEDLNNPMMSNLDLLKQMQAALVKLADTAGGRQELRELFGKGGGKLGAAIGGMDKAKGHSIFNKEDIADADEDTKSLEKMWERVKVWSGRGLVDVSRFGGALGGETSGVPFGAPRKGMKPTGGVTAPMFTDKIAEAEELKVLESQNKLHEAQNKLAFDGMTTEQKKKQLQGEINQLLTDAAALRPSSEVLANDLQLQAVNKQSQLQGLSSMAEKGSPNSDSLTRAGNFLGTSGNAISNIGKKTNDLLTSVHQEIKGLRNAVEGGGTLGVPR